MVEYVVRKLWSWLPMAGLTLGRVVFLKDVRDKLTLEHELVHVEQQARLGWRWWLGYLFALPLGWNPSRARWEAQAYAVQARAGVPVADLARVLSGPMYGWCCRRDRAEELIRGAM